MGFVKEKYDVLICGGGPAGLLVGYGLQRMNISTCVIEKLDKAKMPMYGRACTLYPRTLEMLDQYELLHQLNQIGFIARNSVNYDKNGQRDNNRGWQSMFQEMGISFLDYCLNIRLKYSEEIIYAAYEKLGGFVAVGWEVTRFTTSTAAKDGHPVSLEVTNLTSSVTHTLSGKYLIGADGGQSTIRRLAGIESKSDKSPHRWVRIDGIVETDMPDSRVGFGSIESPTHGNVLWVNLDHARSRIGFALNKSLHEKYGDSMTQEQAVEEAKLSMLPFKVEFKEVDWYTVYSIRQSVANGFIRDRVVLVGDACHTHSSGAAQGMNTGIHDAVNLTWKLAGVLKGWFDAEVLTTYETERRPAAQHLIHLDKTFSALISGTIPEELRSVSADPNFLLRKAWMENTAFSIGLGVSYGANVLNQSTRCGSTRCGARSPDARIYGPGATTPVRLQQVTVNNGAFYIIVFAGEPIVSSSNLKKFRLHLDEKSSFLGASAPQIAKFLTIIKGNRPQADEVMGVRRFGDAYYDHDGSAHTKYGMDHLQGGYAVLRPDGILGFAARLEDVAELSTYFGRFVSPELMSK